VLLGARAARAEYATLLFCAYAIPLGLWATGLRSAWVLLPLATATLAARTVHAVLGGAGGAALNLALVDTARLHAFFGILFALGISLG
jgi:1,4-dihydroxy-2-naphthoate octaprenyltransferase